MRCTHLHASSALLCGSVHGSVMHLHTVSCLHNYVATCTPPLTAVKGQQTLSQFQLLTEGLLALRAFYSVAWHRGRTMMTGADVCVMLICHKTMSSLASCVGHHRLVVSEHPESRLLSQPVR